MKCQRTDHHERKNIMAYNLKRDLDGFYALYFKEERVLMLHDDQIKTDDDKRDHDSILDYMISFYCNT